jgi:hypothetical protein
VTQCVLGCCCSAFLRISARLRQKDHEYIDGAQHKADRCTWGANVDSSWFVLATEEAAAAHLKPATKGLLLEAFAQQSKAVDAPGRVFKFSVRTPVSL